MCVKRTWQFDQIAEYLLSMTDSGTAAPSSQDTQLKRRLSRTRSTKFSQLISGAADIESGSSSRREGLASQGSWGDSTLGAPLVDEDVDGFPQGSKEALQNLPAPWLKEGVYTQVLVTIACALIAPRVRCRPALDCDSRML